MTSDLAAVADPPARARAEGTLTWFSVAAIATWLVVGIWPFSEMVRGRFQYGGALLYVTAFVLYGAAMLTVLILPECRRPLPPATAIFLALVQTVTGIAMNLMTVRYIQGTGAGVGLLVIVAAQLPFLLPGPVVWAWIATQTLVLTAVFFPSWPAEALTIGVAIGGFQIFAAASSMLAISEGQARARLARTNAELTATRELLAESSRMAERLRISRDLHDMLGHHLTALSLQLEVAARLSEPTAALHIEQAHAITRLLLSDVRDVVSTLRDTSRIDVADAVRALAVQPVGAQVHLELLKPLVIDEPARAEAVLRAVQEILTNVARHARAANVWIRIESSPDGIVLTARDDGRGAEAVTWGNGLTGMRERFEACGGRVEVASRDGSGFTIRAVMPGASAA